MVFSLLILVFSVGAMEFESGFGGIVDGSRALAVASLLKISLEDRLIHNIDLYSFCVISWC